MPLFFLLSGFCLTLNYGRKQYDGFDFCCGPCQVVDTLSHKIICCGSCIEKSEDEEQPSSVFDSWRFYINRFSRILPVYWLCMFIALPLVFLGKLIHMQRRTSYRTVYLQDMEFLPHSVGKIYLDLLKPFLDWPQWW